MKRSGGLLLVANWDSAVGYAWWLMEGYWALLADRYRKGNRVFLAYPTISTLPKAIVDAPAQVLEQEFSSTSLQGLRRQCRFLRQQDIKVIYFSDRPTLHWRYAIYRVCGVKKIIVHDHKPGARTMPTGIKKVFKKLLHSVPWVSVDGAIGATEYIRCRLIEVIGVPENRCYVVPNGVTCPDTGIVPTDLNEEFGIPRERKIIVMVARAHFYKGVDFILECISHLRDSGRSDMHFLFVGDGPDLEKFKELSQRFGIEDFCSFCGRRDDVSTLLPSAETAIHASRGEVGYSLAILEYMCASLPVVVPDNPSVCGVTVHGVTGLLYSEGSVESAAEMLGRLLDDEPLRERLGSAGRFAVKEYSLSRAHQSLVRAFDEIASGSLSIG